MTSIWDRSATAASNTATPPAGFPVDQVPSLVAPQFRAEMAYETEFVHSVAATSAAAITSESLGTGNGATTIFSGTLLNHGVTPSSITITAGSVTGTDNGAGVIAGTGISAGSINYATGAWSVTFSTAPANAVAITGAYTPDGYVVTFTNVPASLTDGMEIHVRAPAANTTTNPKLNVNALGAYSIVKQGGAALGAADIHNLHELVLRYNLANTRWELLNPALNVGTSANDVVQLNGSAQLPAVDGSLLTGISAVPSGVIAPFAGSAAPSGWILCFGQAVSRTTYAALFSAISTVFGAGDGSTTFNLPDLRGRAAFGADAMGGTAANRLGSGATGGITGTAALGATGGEQSHVLSVAELANHTHAPGSGGSSFVVNGGSGVQPAAGSGWGYAGSTAGAGSDGAHNNTPPALVLNYIIKA